MTAPGGGVPTNPDGSPNISGLKPQGPQGPKAPPANTGGDTTAQPQAVHVIKVDAGGIHLSNGVTIPLSGPGAAQPAPAAGVQGPPNPPPPSGGPIGPSMPPGFNPTAGQADAAKLGKLEFPGGVVMHTNLPPGASKELAGDIHRLDAMATTTDKQGISQLLPSPDLLNEFNKNRDAAIKAGMAYQQAKQHIDQLQTLLSSGSADAVKHVQTVLDKNGFNVAVDGKPGQQTIDAFITYHNQQLDGFGKAYMDAYHQADPRTLHAFGNTQLEKPAGGIPGNPSITSNQRKFITEYYNQQIANIQKANANLNPQINPQDAALLRKNNAVIATMRANIKAVNDAQQMDPLAAQQVFKNIVEANHEQTMQDIAAANAQQNNEATWGSVAMVLKAAVTTGPVGYVLNSFSRGLSSMMLAENLTKDQGGSSWQQFLNVIGAESGSLLDTITGIPGSFVNSDWGSGAAQGILHLERHGKNDPLIKSLDLTKTAADQQQLTKDGMIESIGQFLTGDNTPQYQAIHGSPPWKLPAIHVGAYNLTSGLPDFIIGLIPGMKDPTMLFTSALHAAVPTALLEDALRSAGNAAAEDAVSHLGTQGLIEYTTRKLGAAAVTSWTESDLTKWAIRDLRGQAQAGVREAWLHTNAVGRTLMRNVHDAVYNTGRAITTPESLMRTFKGLQPLDARRIMAAADQTTSEEGRKLTIEAGVKAAYIRGSWHPEIGAIRQVHIETTAALHLEGVDHTVVGKAVQLNARIDYVRRLGQEKGMLASTYETGARDFANQALDTALKEGGTSFNAAAHDLVDTEGKTLIDRFYAVAQRVDQLNLPAVNSLWEGMVRPFMVNTDLLGRIPLITYENGIFVANPMFETIISRMEVLFAITDGALGERAAEQLKVDLIHGFAVPDNWQSAIMKIATNNLALILPKAAGRVPDRSFIEDSIRNIDSPVIQRYFMNRLENAADKTAMKNLMRDIRAVANNFDLQKEIEKLALGMEKRIQMAAEPLATKDFFGKVATKVARLGLSAVDVAPPREIAFQSLTKNADVLYQVREEAARQAANAYHLAGAVADSVVHQIASARSETEFAAGIERLARVGAMAMGVEDPRVVLDILKEQGHFNAQKFGKSVIRMVTPDGVGQPDLQTLAQKMEAWRIPTPAELSHAFNQAIRQGAVDVTTWRRVNAWIRVVPEKIGDFGITRVAHDASGAIVEHTVRTSIHTLHRWWKFLIVSNAALPIIGAVGGFTGDKHGDLWDRFVASAEGAGIGALGVSRFAFRTALIDDRIRLILQDGVSADNLIPGYAALRTHFWHADGHDFNRRVMSGDLARVGVYGENHFENDILTHVDNTWVVVQPTDRNAPQALARVVNDQINPETDTVVKIVLNEKAGLLPQEVRRTKGRLVTTPAGVEKRDLPQQEASPNLFKEAFGSGDPTEQLPPLRSGYTRLYNGGADSNQQMWTNRYSRAYSYRKGNSGLMPPEIRYIDVPNGVADAHFTGNDSVAAAARQANHQPATDKDFFFPEGVGQHGMVHDHPIVEPDPASGTPNFPEPDLAAGMNARLDAKYGTSEEARNTTIMDQFHSDPRSAGWSGQTKTFYRGEPANAMGERRGVFFTDSEEQAQKYAKEGGIVYSVELPVDEHGVALVGYTAKPENRVGRILDQEDRTWADAAQAQYQVHFRPAETKRTAGKLVPETQREASDRLLAQFFKTDEGKLWLQRMKSGYLGPKSAKQAVARIRKFIDTYTNEEIARARVAGGIDGAPQIVDTAFLKKHLDAGNVAVSGIHGKAVWRIPKSWPDIFRRGNDMQRMLQQHLMSGPSNFLNRGPTQNIVFRKEYDRLLSNGIAPEEAQSLADSFALTFTNGTFHRYTNLTTSATKLDLFMPFQHAREDMIKFYGTMVIEHPARTFRVLWGTARIFNDGKQNGTFRKNPITGAWEFTIPGAGMLSTALMGMPFSDSLQVPVEDFLTIGAGAYIGGEKMLFPHFGGPFWTVIQGGLAKAFPEMVINKSTWESWLFPFHSPGNFLSSNSSRLWMAMTSTAPPWEVLNQKYWQGEIDHWQREVGQEMIYQNAIHGYPHGKDYLPTQAEVEKQTMNFFKVWSFYSSIVPASTYMTMPDKNAYDQAVSSVTLGGALTRFYTTTDPTTGATIQHDRVLDAYPQFAAFADGGSSTKYVGPEDMATLHKIKYDGPFGIGTYDPMTGEWKSPQSAENYGNEERMGWRVPTDWSAYRQAFLDNKRTGEYYTALSNAKKIPDLWEREQKYSEISRQYADVVGKYNREEEIKSEVNTIMFQYPKSMQASAYERVKATFGLSNTDLIKVQHQVNDPYWQANPWAGTRDGEAITEDMQRRFGSDMTQPAVARYVATLRPTEQHNFWQYQMDAMGYHGGSPTKYKPLVDNSFIVMQQYQLFKSHDDALYAQYPVLTPKNKVDSWSNPETKHIAGLKQATYDSMQTIYTRINNLNTALNNAYNSKNYKAVDALTTQRDAAYQLLSDIRDQWLGKLPNLTKAYADLHAMTVYEALGENALAENEYRMAVMDAQSAPYILTSQQSQFMHMPATVQQAYVKTLVDGLNMPVGKSNYDVTQYVQEITGLHHLYWDYLSPVQQSELTVMYPAMVDTWKYMSWWYLRGPGAKQVHYSKRGKKYYTAGLPLNLQGIPHDLAYAYALYGKYDKRTGPVPKDYQHYLSLPSNYAVKANFLISHPDVLKYLQEGPLSQMPTHERDMVTNILVRYGQYSAAKYGSSSKYYKYHKSKSWVGLHPAHYNGSNYNGQPGPQGSGYADYKWAEYQLYAWDRRPQHNGKVDPPPATYKLWLNMPSGVAKAEYLKHHPEVEAWIKMGPMANMPQEYQDIVRSILVQYGDWTQTVNPLADTITQYFATPHYAQAEFLAQHPELEVYWSLTKTPQELANQELENTYFSIQDVQAKRAFLLSHPELQTHLLQAHQLRYETFLNQVASYMGANPGMFQQYMKDQNAVLAELLQKFAQPALLREAPVRSIDASVSSGGGVSSEGSRQRKTKGPGRVRTSAR